MKDCYICGRKDTKYSGILCSNAICNVCAESAMYNEEGYDEDNHRVGKCPRGKSKKIDNVSGAPVAVKNNAVKLIGNIGGNTENSVSKSNEKFDRKRSMQQNFHPFFSRPASRKRKSKDDTQRKSEDVADTVAEVLQSKLKVKKRRENLISMKEKIKRVQLQLFNLLLKIQVNQRCVKARYLLNSRRFLMTLMKLKFTTIIFAMNEIVKKFVLMT